MTHFTHRNLRQDLTYWAPQGSETNDFGHAIMIAPILIKGRWEDKVQAVRRANGEEFTSRAEVLVDRDLALEGFLIIGDYTAEAKPVEDASEIQEFAVVPDLRNLGSERRAFL